MNPIYEAYVGCIVEKEVSDEYSIYITCKLSKDLQDRWKLLVHNLDEADEVETDPHCTFLWAKLNEEFKEDEVFDFLKPLLENMEFYLQPMGFKIFEDVNEGTRNCLVVRLDAPGEITQHQLEVKQRLKDEGMEMAQDYPEWKPHMTIAYYPVDTKIRFEQPNNGMLDTPIKTTIDFMKMNNSKKELKFNSTEDKD